MSKHLDFSILELELPAIIWRSRWDDLAAKHGLPFRKGYMQNLDSLGLGPVKFYSRGRVAYMRADLIRWLNVFMASNAPDAKATEIQGWLND